MLEALNYPGLSGRYRVNRDGKDLRLHLELASLKPTMVQFRFGPNTVLQHYHSDNPEPAALKAGRTSAELSHTGDGQIRPRVPPGTGQPDTGHHVGVFRRGADPFRDPERTRKMKTFNIGTNFFLTDVYIK